MKKNLLSALVAGFFSPAVGTIVNLSSSVAKIPAGVTADNTAMGGMYGFVNNIDSIDWDVNAIVSSALTLTMTGAQFYANVIDYSGSPASGVTVTTPTAAQIIAAMPNTIPGDGYAFPWFFVNETGQTVTLSGGTGVTVAGNNTMATNTTRHFVVNVNVNASTVTIINLGTVNL